MGNLLGRMELSKARCEHYRSAQLLFQILRQPDDQDLRSRFSSGQLDMDNGHRTLLTKRNGQYCTILAHISKTISMSLYLYG